MTKIIYNNEEIDIVDHLKEGEEEFDLLDSEKNKQLILKKEEEKNEQRPNN